MVHPVTATTDAPETPDAITLSRFREWLAALPRDAAPPSPAFAADTEPSPPSLVPPFRPAATPTAAGVTKGFEFLVADVRRRGSARRLARLLDADDDLAAALERLFVDLAARRAPRRKGGGRG